VPEKAHNTEHDVNATTNCNHTFLAGGAPAPCARFRFESVSPFARLPKGPKATWAVPYQNTQYPATQAALNMQTHLEKGVEVCLGTTKDIAVLFARGLVQVKAVGHFSG